MIINRVIKLYVSEAILKNLKKSKHAFLFLNNADEL